MNFNNLTTPSCPSQYSVHPQENIVTNKYSFFYAPSNDFQLYHIFCEETPLTFELVSRLINNADNNLIHNYSRFDNTYVFYHQQPEIKKIYRVTCEMISHTFIFQFLNKIIYGNYSFQYEYEQQEFSKRHQENLKFHLKKDLIHYLTSKPTYEQESDLFKKFIQDYYVYESMINPDSTQMSNPQNDKDLR
ncbi:kinase-like domain-containing protein [Rhizophagus clarus]|uniref:Kinase-like domain-containing protein n=1 Tax=Rhizophagus clarus TaxID=94130 RepID=A0A8H3M044_9GLOM|nr:kinase-like domain-containing protein [Rhizophagus clarus]